MSLSKDPVLLRRNDCNDSETGLCYPGDGLFDKSRGNRVFDIEAFYQLRLERLENQRKREQERMQRRVLRSTPRVRVDVGSTFRSPSSVVDFPLTDISQSPKIVKVESFQASVSAEEINDQSVISSARQELIRLGRRYASSQGGRLMTATHANATSSHDGNGRSTPFLDEISFDGTATTSRIIDNQHLPTEGIGVQGMYLILARSHSPPNHHDHIENGIIDDEDGSASESYSTPTTPCLQTYLDNNECHAQQDDKKLDPFSSFYAAQLLLPEIEDKLLKQPKQVPMHLHEAHHENSVQQKRKIDRGKAFFIIFLLIVLPGLASLNWFRRVQLHFVSKMISIHYNACLQFMQQNHWTMTLRFQTLMDQLSSLREHNMTQYLLSWVKARWINPIGMFTKWSCDIIRISCIKCIHFLHKGFRDTLAIAIAAKYRIIDARRCALTVANATKQTIFEDPFVSLWRNSMVEKQADTSHGFEPHQLMRSMLTPPELHWSDYGAVSLFGWNGTLLLLNDVEVAVAEPVIRSWFWRKPIRMPFLRSRLPSKRPSYLHSLPSFDSAQADDSNPISSSLPWPSESNKRCCTTSPLVLPSRPRLKLVTPRLDGTALSSNIQKNASASMITQTTRPPKQFVKQQVIAATMKSTFYSSSYPLEEQNGGKSVFDEMDLVHELVWEVLLRFQRITLGG